MEGRPGKPLGEASPATRSSPAGAAVRDLPVAGRPAGPRRRSRQPRSDQPCLAMSDVPGTLPSPTSRQAPVIRLNEDQRSCAGTEKELDKDVAGRRILVPLAGWRFRVVLPQRPALSSGSRGGLIEVLEGGGRPFRRGGRHPRPAQRVGPAGGRAVLPRAPAGGPRLHVAGPQSRRLPQGEDGVNTETAAQILGVGKDVAVSVAAASGAIVPRVVPGSPRPCAGRYEDHLRIRQAGVFWLVSPGAACWSNRDLGLPPPALPVGSAPQPPLRRVCPLRPDDGYGLSPRCLHYCSSSCVRAFTR